MKADRILVVMNGEIIEEGSHDELIHKKGKYHDLWAKQIMVKPAADRSRSSSPKKRDPHIINDLTPKRQEVELAKALKTTPHEEPKPAKTTHGADEGKKAAQCPFNEDTKKPVDDKKAGGGHQREVSEETD